MARRDSELDKARTERRDLDVGLRVAARAVHGARLEQTEGLELAGQLAVDARMGAELVELEVRLLPTQPDRLPPSARLGTRRGELLSDDSQRQELVALQPENRLQAVDVLLAEQAIPARRPARSQEPLVFEVADLGDGDVGELRLQALAHRADRVQPLSAARRLRSGLGGRAHLDRKISRYFPIWSSSSSSSSAESTRRRLTKVPLRLP